MPSQHPITVAIGIVYRGGPAPGNSDHLVPGTIRLTGRGIDASQPVADGHTATFRVPPGDYTATARSGSAQCHATKVQVTSGAQSRVLIHCDVK